MPTYRMKAEFDLTFTDEEAAALLARQSIIRQVDHAIVEGNIIDSGNKTPLEQVNNLSESPLLISSMIVAEVLARGASQLPFEVQLRDYKVEHVNQ